MTSDPSDHRQDEAEHAAMMRALDARLRAAADEVGGMRVLWSLIKFDVIQPRDEAGNPLPPPSAEILPFPARHHRRPRP